MVIFKLALISILGASAMALSCYSLSPYSNVVEVKHHQRFCYSLFSPSENSASHGGQTVHPAKASKLWHLESSKDCVEKIIKAVEAERSLYICHATARREFYTIVEQMEAIIKESHNLENQFFMTLTPFRLFADYQGAAISHRKSIANFQTCLEKIEMMKGLGVLKGLDIEEQLEHCGIVNAQIKTFGRVSRLMNNHAIFAEPSSNLAYSIRRDYEENQKNVWRIVVLFDDLRVKDQENPGNVVPAVNAELPIRASNSEFSNVPKTGILRNSSENSHEKTHTAFNSAAHNLDAGPSSQHGRDASRRRQKRSVTFLLTTRDYH
ncbi:Protein CBG08933 [Caenorhabditis briggsae]|uniref:Protein CBG08933 n=1 Tax=Caenorhabditis briggsae TaxID=6238 RepID=A8X7Q5_CAEBR|nr:Protein CBG08933 [Caenorhabditis briggsae]CAP28666.2 Protein CBG08933 [Caenorhabditis briggsae]